MNEPVQMPRTLFYLLSHVVVDLHIEDIRDEIQGILIVLYLGVQASQVEAVRQVVLVDLAEVLVATRCYELCVLSQLDFES